MRLSKSSPILLQFCSSADPTLYMARGNVTPGYSTTTYTINFKRGNWMLLHVPDAPAKFKNNCSISSCAACGGHRRQPEISLSPHADHHFTMGDFYGTQGYSTTTEWNGLWTWT